MINILMDFIIGITPYCIGIGAGLYALNKMSSVWIEKIKGNKKKLDDGINFPFNSIQEATASAKQALTMQINTIEAKYKAEGKNPKDDLAYKTIKKQLDQSDKINNFISSNPIASILDMFGIPIFKRYMPKLEKKMDNIIRDI